MANTELPTVNLGGEFLSIADLESLAGDVSGRSEKFAKRIDQLETDVATRQTEAEARWEQVTSMRKAERRQHAAKEVSKFRRGIVEKTDDERWQALRELKAEADRVSAAEAHYTSPAALLAREGLGTDERSRYMAQVANSGPAELRNFAQVAAATGNLLLAVAILNRLDTMRPDDRKAVGITRQALAKALVGADFDKAQRSITVVRNRVQAALNRNRALQNGGGSPLANIKLALDRRGEGATAGD